jgi:myo-inositol-1(or 4)-monophosphatase
VSIALSLDGRVILGVVYNPHADELFVARAGSGATLNGAPIQVSKIAAMAHAMVASALTYDGRQADRPQLDRLGRVLGAAQAVRSDGCAALDLCDVARGRFEGYFERGLRPWDSAAGALIVTCAGGRVTGFSGQPHDPFAAETLASNGLIHDPLVQLM